MAGLMIMSKLRNTPQQPVRYAHIASPYFAVLCSVFIAIMIISNIVSSVPVVIDIPGTSLQINSDGAFYIFPIAYVIDDVISEVYGFAASRRIIFLGFAVLIATATCYRLTAWLPHGVADVSSFTNVAVASTRLVVAGLSGYLCGELLNTYVLVNMKKISGERKLWARLLASAVIGELVDTTVFCFIAAPVLGYNSLGEALNYAGFGFGWKTLVEIMVIPITYRVCAYVKNRELSYWESADL